MTERQLSCEEVLEQLFTYLDGEIDAASSADIDRHLARCRDCYTRAEFEKKLRLKTEQAGGSAPAPERLRARIRGLLDRY